jgi:hypothetical protein
MSNDLNDFLLNRNIENETNEHKIEARKKAHLKEVNQLFSLVKEWLSATSKELLTIEEVTSM